MKAGIARAAVVSTAILTAFSGQPSFAETGAPPPARAQSVIVYGDEPCPKAEGDEIVVCSRRPETERFRIPKELREEGQPLAEQSLAARVETLDDLTRFARPNSCSVVGTGGQTGCLQQMLQNWRALRRAAAAEAASIP